MNPYDIPHDCERESVAAALDKLSAAQRRVVRSYVRKVECGDLSLTEWIANDPDSVSFSTWRKPAGKGGNYWGTEEDPVYLFRGAVGLYRKAWLTWETTEEEKAIRQASRRLRLAAPKAATQLADIIEKGQVSFERADQVVVKQARIGDVLRAALSVLDRAGIETADKSQENLQIEITYADTDLDPNVTEAS